MIVADDAFPLKDYIQKPYSQVGLTKEKRIYNYRLSRARRIAENALANRFRIFMAPIPLVPEKVEIIVTACCSLHNFLRTQPEACAVYTPTGSLDSENPNTHKVVNGEWRQGERLQGLVPTQRLGGNRHSNSVKDYRDYL